MRIAGTVFWRGEEGSEQARADAVWNARKLGRYPDVIVQLGAKHDPEGLFQSYLVASPDSGP
jgi:hypothetical protein